MMRGGNSGKEMIRLAGLAAAVICGLASCDPAPPPEVAFYHWQTSFRPDSIATARLAQASHLYIKVLDVAWDRSAYPTGLLNLDTTRVPEGVQLIPTIFITNETMLNIAPDQVPLLAERMMRKAREQLYYRDFSELQLDCDWSAAGRENYFALLREVRKLLPPGTRLSATLRLHQWKDPDGTGVPPVDRALLMCYNVGEVRFWETENSINSLDDARPYLDAERYPLPLDIGLPLFRWGVLFKRTLLLGLINELGPEALSDTTYYERTAPNRYLVRKSTYLDNRYLYAGNLIRLETVTAADLDAWAAELSRHAWPTDLRVVFFHLGGPLLANFTHDQLQQVAVVCSGR
ncbi:MAG: hypothetical protein WBA17_13670 [Saprospiraceae bacterium]